MSDQIEISPAAAYIKRVSKAAALPSISPELEAELEAAHDALSPEDKAQVDAVMHGIMYVVENAPKPPDVL